MKTVSLILVLATTQVALSTTRARAESLPAGHSVDFHREVLPILSRRCSTCHASGRREGGLSLQNRRTLMTGGDSGPAVIAGNGSESLLIQLVSGHDEDRIMPEQGKRLTEKEIAILSAWIDQGVAWDGDVSLRKLTLRTWKPNTVQLPPYANGESPNPIDRILRPTIQNANSPADDQTFVRRVFMDAGGMLPQTADVESFVNNPQRLKNKQLVDRLLSDNHLYAQHWLSFWNDLLRNDYSGTGFIDGGRKPITIWLYQSLVNNKPYDQFVNELISAAPGAEGFTHGIVWRGRVNASQRPPLQAAQNLSQVFLGLNLKCASCHDSFVSQWTLQDAYGLAGMFSDKPLEIFRCDKATGKIAPPQFFNSEIGNVTFSDNRGERQKQLAKLITGPANARLPRTVVNRIWKKLMGRGIIEPVDEMDNEPFNSELLDWLADDLVAHNYDLKHTIRTILTSQHYRLQSTALTLQDEGREFKFTGPVVKRMSAEQMLDAIWLITGTGPKQPASRGKKPKPMGLPDQPAFGFYRASLVKSDALMRSLGRPNREQVVSTRPDRLTTLQALDLSNGDIMSKLTTDGAKRLLKDHPELTFKQFVDVLFMQALGRNPTANELSVFDGTVINSEKANEESLTDLLWVIFALPEFQLIR